MADFTQVGSQRMSLALARRSGVVVTTQTGIRSVRMAERRGKLYPTACGVPGIDVAGVTVSGGVGMRSGFADGYGGIVAVGTQIPRLAVRER